MTINAGQPVFDDRERANILDCLNSTRITMGKWVERLEAEFAAYVGVKHALAVSSGTAALHLALLAVGVLPGDEVIVPALTFVATANAVTYCGAKPVIVDVDPDTWTMDMQAAIDACSWRTRVILPVHLYGVPADLVSIYDALDRQSNAFNPKRIKVIEDAAESLGAECRGPYSGTLKTGNSGAIGCFSFYGNKTITTGEGGMITTDNDNIAAQIRLLRGQGMDVNRRYWHDVVGYNYRMTDLQAAIGCAQLEKLPNFLRARKNVAEWYHAYLDGQPGIHFQQTRPGDVSGNWAVAVELNYDIHKARLIEELADRGIETRPVFYPLNQFPMYKDGKYHENAERIARRGIVLPTHAAMTRHDVALVCEALVEVMEGEYERA